MSVPNTSRTTRVHIIKSLIMVHRISSISLRLTISVRVRGRRRMDGGYISRRIRKSVRIIGKDYGKAGVEVSFSKLISLKMMFSLMNRKNLMNNQTL